MERSESIGELAKALAAFRSELPAIGRNRTVSVRMKSGGSYTFDYMTLDHMLEVAVPILSKHGLSISQFVTEQGISTILMHASGEFLEGATPFGKLSYSSAQDLGGIITYLRRYAIASVLGIASDDDDDANAASGNRATQKPKKALKPKPAPSTNGDLNLGTLLNAAVAVGQNRKDVIAEAGKRYGTTKLEELSPVQMEELLSVYTN